MPVKCLRLHPLAGVAHLSFARSLTETRVFFGCIGRPDALPFSRRYQSYVLLCARYQVRIKPGRSFPRNQQEYRRKARGLEIKRRGRRWLTPPPDERLRPELEGQTLRPLIG